ncbi:terminase small subunit [Hyphomicrobium sulfonivorans]|nr:terminase small subunit [Hyphomicrobium sulfonivorans]
MAKPAPKGRKPGKAASGPDGLTVKQAAFVQAYIETGNASEAYRRAYDAKGMKSATVNRKAFELLENGKIAARIAHLQAKTAEKHEITKDRIVAELAKIAFADIRQAVKWGSTPLDTTSENASPNGLNIYPVALVPSELIADDIAAAVSEVSLTQSGVKIRMYDKKSALVDLAKMLGFMVEKHEHTGKDGEKLAPTVIQLVPVSATNDHSANPSA